MRPYHIGIDYIGAALFLSNLQADEYKPRFQKLIATLGDDVLFLEIKVLNKEYGDCHLMNDPRTELIAEYDEALRRRLTRYSSRE
jgi:hypothetical protein